MNRSRKIEFANTLRGLAAILVVFSHLSALFWNSRETVVRITGMPRLPDEVLPTWLAQIPTTIAGVIPRLDFGAFGVALFFLISGFVIPISLGRASALSFLTARVIRIFPTYAVSFAITVLALYIGYSYFNVEPHRSIYEFLTNAFPALRLATGTVAVDSVAWSLEVEVIFYLLCAASISLFRSKSLFVFMAPGGATAALVISYFFGHPLGYKSVEVLRYATHLSFMYIGVVFYYQFIGRTNLHQSIAIVMALCASSSVAWCTVWGFANFSYTSNSYGYALALFTACYVLRYSFRSNPFTNYFANISFPLYVLHAAPGYVLMRLLVENGLSSTTATLAAFGYALMAATIVHWLVERPTQQMSSRINKGLPLWAPKIVHVP